MAATLHDSLKTIEAYKQSTPHYSDLLDILGDILILREEHKRRTPEGTFPVDEGLVRQKLQGGFPLVDFVRGSLDLTLPRAYFTALLAIAEKHAPEETAALRTQIEDGSLDYERMVRLSFETPAEADGAEPGEAEAEEDASEEFLDLVELFLEESLRPALEKVAEAYGPRVAEAGWSEGFCPICGKEPKIGEIVEEEGRFLFCSQCGFRWRFERIKCPFCGNEEQQSLAYFTVEGEERYRVDVCNECKRYIKTVDSREGKGEANLDVEDMATLHLDLLATEEGYE